MTNEDYSGELPDIPADPDMTTYIELTENNAPRKCLCGESADFFIYSVADDGEVLVCEALCDTHLAESPRTDPNGRQNGNAN